MVIGFRKGRRQEQREMSAHGQSASRRRGHRQSARFDGLGRLIQHRFDRTTIRGTKRGGISTPLEKREETYRFDLDGSAVRRRWWNNRTCENPSLYNPSRHTDMSYRQYTTHSALSKPYLPIAHCPASCLACLSHYQIILFLRQPLPRSHSHRRRRHRHCLSPVII